MTMVETYVLSGLNIQVHPEYLPKDKFRCRRAALAPLRALTAYDSLTRGLHLAPSDAGALRALRSESSANLRMPPTIVNVGNLDDH